MATVTERYASAPAGQGATSVLTPTSTMQSGHAQLIFASSGVGLDKEIASVTDSVGGNTWAVVIGYFTSRSVSVAYCSSLVNQITTSDTVTITWSNATSTQVPMWIQEVNAKLLADQTGTGTGTSGTSVSAGPTGTLAEASEIAFATFRINSATGYTPGSPWISTTTPVLQSNVAALQYLEVSSTAALTASGVFGGSGTSWVGIVATFRPSRRPFVNPAVNFQDPAYV